MSRSKWRQGGCVLPDGAQEQGDQGPSVEPVDTEWSWEVRGEVKRVSTETGDFVSGTEAGQAVDTW